MEELPSPGILPEPEPPPSLEQHDTTWLQDVMHTVTNEALPSIKTLIKQDNNTTKTKDTTTKHTIKLIHTNYNYHPYSSRHQNHQYQTITKTTTTNLMLCHSGSGIGRVIVVVLMMVWY